MANRMKKSLIVVRMLLIVCLVGCIEAMYAQNNPYKIDDELYGYYAKAFRQRTNPEGLLMADTLLRMAEAKGDGKAVCMALTIPINYYFAKRDAEHVAEAVARCKEASRKYNFMQYYYHAYTMEINTLLNIGRQRAAFAMAEEMRRESVENGDHYGFFCCLRMMGNLYYARGDYHKAAANFQEALDYMDRYLPDQDKGTISSTLANCYFQANDKDQAEAYAKLALQWAKTEKVALDAKYVIGKVLFARQKYAEFRQFFDKEILNSSQAYSVNFHVLQSYRYLIDRRFAEAHREADKIRDAHTCQNIHLQILEWEGRYPEALNLMRRSRRYVDSVRAVAQSQDLAELNAELENEKLKQDKRDLEMKQLMAAADRQRLLSNGLLLFLLFIVAAVALYLRQRRKVESILRHKNEELDQAREKAEESERMKTLFMQNMSHEIRTPLNSIVGFSELLSTPGMDFTDEEKEEYSALIKHNSALLSNLINDVLDLSSLESGRYSIVITPTHVNEVLQQSVSTVIHNKPKEVNLYFTTEVDDSYTILTDANRLQQVLINYLTNAEKHTDRGEIHLHCSLTENPGKLTFSVTDTGCGIPESEREHIFERFKKLDLFKQGTGLGLNICRIIAMRLNAEAKLDVNYHQGARFLFILPIPKEDEVAFSPENNKSITK